MVKRILLVALLACFACSSFASESGRIAYRAQKLLTNGRFAAAYDAYSVALLASRKESDLLSEARILLLMAQIRINSLDLVLADSLISVIREPSLDAVTRVALLEARMELANAKGEANAVLKLARSVDEDDFDEASDGLQAAYYAEKSYAFAALRNADSARAVVDYVRKSLSKSDGRYVLACARVEELLENWNVADSLYNKAEKISISENRIYRTASILYHRSIILDKLGRKEEAEDARKRSAQAFELMGLPNLKKRSEQGN